MPPTTCTTDLETPDSLALTETEPPRCESCDDDLTDGECRDCVACYDCDDLVPSEQTVRTQDYERVCRRCQRASYSQCERCDSWYPDVDGCSNNCDDDHDGYCDCDDCGEDRGEYVHRYEYKPTPQFHGSGSLFLGPEIEVTTPYERTHECARLASDHLGSLGYLKEDSSIGRGFEIVTHPMSYDWALANFPWTMLTALNNMGCDTPSYTGIHVHLSRAGFSSPCHVYRWMKFIYRNEPQVVTMARRSSPEFAAFTDHDRRAVKDYAKGAYSDRYRAINTRNEDTFELRIFASSLNPDVVKAVFAFAAASVEYTRELTAYQVATAGGWTWAVFVNWASIRPIYTPLVRELEALACVC